jgi:hypothetical protein
VPPLKELESKPDSSRLAGAAKPDRADAIASAPAGKDLAGARPESAFPEVQLDKKVAAPTAENKQEVKAAVPAVRVQGAEFPRAESGTTGLKKESELRDQQSGAQSQNQGQMTTNAPRGAGPAPPTQVMSSREKAKRVPEAPAPLSVGEALAYSGPARALEAVSLSNPRLILASGTNSSWRTGPAGLIEFSADQGKTWTRQVSGVLTDLLTGTAPSASTCWIVGRAGTVLLTTDRGAHWKVVKIPFTEDLGGVHASDAMHATIWNSRNTQYFQTSDGGQRWQPAPDR